MQTLSHRLWVRQTSNHHNCDQHAQKPKCRDFQVILSISSWSKTTLCIFKEQLWFPNRKCYEKINSVLILSTESSLSIFLSQHFMQVTNCSGIALCAGLNTSLLTDCKSCTLLTSVQNDTGNTDARDTTDDADDYNRMTGIALLNHVESLHFKHICLTTFKLLAHIYLGASFDMGSVSLLVLASINPYATSLLSELIAFLYEII